MLAGESLVRAALNPKKFRFVEQLSSYLHQHFILHEPGRFLILPKPYGISCVGEKSPEGGVFKNSQYSKADGGNEDFKAATRRMEDVTIGDCIPALATAFREPKLHFCVGLKRYYSGAIVLPASEAEFRNITNSMKFISQTTADHGEYHYRCLALLMGTLPQKSGSVTGYATFQKVGQRSEYIFVAEKSNQRAKSGKFAVEGTVEYSVLAEKHGCSLVEFGVNKFARHLPRLVFSHLMCPILGDPLYSQRIAEIDGAPVLVNPGQRQKKVRQWFPKKLGEQLGMQPADLLKSMPLYCHVYQTAFPRYGWAIGRKMREQDVQDLFASAPPPPHFLAMAEALELNTALAGFLRGDESSDLGRGDDRGGTHFV